MSRTPGRLDGDPGGSAGVWGHEAERASFPVSGRRGRGVGLQAAGRGASGRSARGPRSLVPRAGPVGPPLAPFRVSCPPSGPAPCRPTSPSRGREWRRRAELRTRGGGRSPLRAAPGGRAGTPGPRGSGQRLGPRSSGHRCSPLTRPLPRAACRVSALTGKPRAAGPQAALLALAGPGGPVSKGTKRGSVSGRGPSRSSHLTPRAEPPPSHAEPCASCLSHT